MKTYLDILKAEIEKQKVFVELAQKVSEILETFEVNELFSTWITGQYLYISCNRTDMLKIRPVLVKELGLNNSYSRYFSEGSGCLYYYLENSERVSNIIFVLTEAPPSCKIIKVEEDVPAKHVTKYVMNCNAVEDSTSNL